MKKLLLIGLALMVVCAVAWTVRVSAQEKKTGETGPTDIVLEASNGNINFAHKKHVDEHGVACTTCHHSSKEGETPTSCASEGCHSATSEVNLRNAFHKLCYKGCHTEKDQNEGKSAPTKCSACHIKTE